MSEDHFSKGRFLIEKGDFEGAISEFSLGIEKDPKVHQNYLFRGICSTRNPKTRNLPKAIEDFSTILERVGQEGEEVPEGIVLQAYFHRANAYMLLENEGKKAIEDFSKYLEMNPNPMIYFNRAQLNYEIKEYSKAIEDCGECLKLIPHNPPSIVFLRSMCYFEISDFEKSSEDCRLILETSESFSASILLAFDLFMMNSSTKAFYQLGKAVQILKGSPSRFVMEVESLKGSLFQEEKKMKILGGENKKNEFLEEVLEEIFETVKGVEAGGCCGGGCGCGKKNNEKKEEKKEKGCCGGGGHHHHHE